MIIKPSMFATNASTRVGFVSLVRRFYRRYLSKYVLFRFLKTFFLRVYFRHQWAFLRITAVGQRIFIFKFINMSEFSINQGIECRHVFPSEKILISGPRFCGNYPIFLDFAENILLNSPKIEIRILPSMTAIGGTNFLIKKRKLIYPDLMRPERDATRAEVLGVANIGDDFKSINVRMPRRVKKLNLRAISLLGECTGNYAHWVMETLPKIAIIEAEKSLMGYPLLIDAWLPEKFRDSINFLSDDARKLVEVKIWEPLEVAELVDISAPSYIPFESRQYFTNKIVPKPAADSFLFSRSALELLRCRSNAIAHKRGGLVRKSRFLYLRRPKESVGQGRLLLNSCEVESILARKGFEVIDPGGMSFEEQVALFSSAACVVSPIGAALANLAFCPAGAKVVALAPFYADANYFFYSNFLGALGHELRYVVGPQDLDNDAHIAHRNYSVDISALQDALSWAVLRG